MHCLGCEWSSVAVRGPNDPVTDGGRATHPRPGRFEGTRRETRDAARERRRRREVESQQRAGVGDQDPDDGRCPDCRGDVLLCLDCLLNRGDARGE